MPARRTNLALLALLVAVAATGLGAYAVGTPRGRVVVVAHGVVGVALALLARPKTAIARRGWQRERPARGLSLGLAVTVVVALLSGFAHSTGLLRGGGPLTALQVHVGAALVALGLLGAHVRAHPQRPRRSDLGRRALLRAGVTLGGAAAAYAVLDALPLPGRARRFTGSYAAGAPVPTTWFTDTVPTIDPDAWRLVTVARGRRREWTLAELDAVGDEVVATLDCTGGWYARATWRGVRLQRLLPAGRSVEVVSVTGYRRRLPYDAPLLLATRLDGALLTAGHGAPLRLVAPGRRGFWWVKWVARVELTNALPWAQPPFPLQ